MSGTIPTERWSRHVIERYMALKISGEWKKLRAKGLRVLGRKKLYTAEEWYSIHLCLTKSKKYMEWYAKCRELGDRFGLAPWTIEMLCLLKGFDPEGCGLVLESEWPTIRLITENTDPNYLSRLAFEAQRFGINIIQKQGSSETICLFSSNRPIEVMDAPPSPPKLPYPHNTFRIRIETPVGYPPEGKAEMEKRADMIGKEILSRLGYNIPKRLRTSQLVLQIADLKMSKKTLDWGESYDIVDKIYGDDDLNQDKQRRKRVIDKRSKMKKKFSQYGINSND